MMKFKGMAAGLTALFLVAGNMVVYADTFPQMYDDPVMETDAAIVSDAMTIIEDITEETVKEDKEEEPAAQFEEEKTQSIPEGVNAGTVNVRSHLNIRSGAGKNYEVIGHLMPGDEVEVVGGSGDWYEIIAPETYGYVYGNYLELFQKPEAEESNTQPEEPPLPEILETQAGLTPEGNLTLVDDIGAPVEAGQQFITFVTKNGNYFYLIIDRDDKGSENVHLLDLVDERDLLSLLSDEEAEKYETEKGEIMETKVPEPELTETVDEEAEEPEEKKKGNAFMLTFIVLIVIIIGAFFVFKKLKPEGRKKERPDPDMDYEEDDDAYDLPDGEYEDENEEEIVFSEEISPQESDEEALAKSEEE